jgi:hypothetical protein
LSAWAAVRSIPAVLGLMVRAPGWALDYSMSYKRAKREFRKQLIDEGVPRDDAFELAELFPFKMSDVIETVRSAN